MRIRTLFLLFVPLMLAAAPAAYAQGRVIDLTVDMLERFFKAYDTEKSEMANVDPQLQEVDEKIKKFRDCRLAFEAAGEASGSKVGGLAARMAMRAKCGASDESGFQKERQKIVEGPQNKGAAAGGFKTPDYLNLRSKLQSYLGGDHSGFSKSGLDVVAAREKDLASLFGVSLTVAQAGGSEGRRGRGARMPGSWSVDYAWGFIYQLFAVQYLSGATMFETQYQPGQWTRWQMVQADEPDERQTVERAFIGKTAEGAEWWRYKTIVAYKDGDKEVADTVILEALFKPTDEYVRELVRMRGKLPGNAEPQEMMVPQQWSMWNWAGAFQMKPTKESVEGATVGVVEVKTPAGSFQARHVRYGMGGGTLNYFLDDKVPGGWVRFNFIGEDKDSQYTMELVGYGTGAKSELGVKM